MKVFIVDDSRLARKELCGLLVEHPHMQLIGEAADIASSLIAIPTLKPDLLLLDIHLPDGTGFDLLDRCDFTPKVIFTTAYEQHALRAFEINALDYLLKPITQERFSAALERLAHQHADSPKILRKSDEHIFIRDGERCHFVKFNEISYLQIEGNYVRFHFRNTHALLLRSLNYVEERLDPTTFFRANRQQIINLNFIAKIEPWMGDTLLITMNDDAKIEASRRQTKELKQKLEI